MPTDDLRLADLLAALSVATDLGMGQEPEKAVRGCLVATELARAMDLPGHQVHDVYWTTLLMHVGCTAPAHEAARTTCRGASSSGSSRIVRIRPSRSVMARLPRHGLE